MTKNEFDIWRAKHLSNKNTKNGIECFEKYVGRVNWLHPEDETSKALNTKVYRVINRRGEVVFESGKISGVAKELCVSASRVSESINNVNWIKGQYLVERCDNE